MNLTEKQKHHLRSLAHRLKPVVIVGGSGVSDSVLRELDLSLEHHELLKVRVNASDRDERQILIEKLCDRVGAQLVQTIGHVAILYRATKKPSIRLP